MAEAYYWLAEISSSVHFFASLVVGMSHNLTVLSLLPDAKVLPSGLNATKNTGPLCPLMVAVFLPVAVSHSLSSCSNFPTPEFCHLDSNPRKTRDHYARGGWWFLVGGHVPKPNRLVKTSRGQRLAVWTISHAQNKTTMPVEDGVFLSVAMSQSLIVLSKPPKAKVLPSRLYAMHLTPSVFPLRVAVFLPVVTSHSLTALFKPPEAKVLPFPLYATDSTGPVCSPSVAVFLPVVTSHNFIVVSILPEARVLPSGLNAMEVTPPECPLRVAVFLPVVTSHSLIVLSKLPDAKVLPSGLNATA